MLPSLSASVVIYSPGTGIEPEADEGDEIQNVPQVNNTPHNGIEVLKESQCRHETDDRPREPPTEEVQNERKTKQQKSKTKDHRYNKSDYLVAGRG